MYIMITSFPVVSFEGWLMDKMTTWISSCSSKSEKLKYIRFGAKVMYKSSAALKLFNCSNVIHLATCHFVKSEYNVHSSFHISVWVSNRAWMQVSSQLRGNKTFDPSTRDCSVNYLQVVYPFLSMSGSKVLLDTTPMNFTTMFDVIPALT